MCLVLAIWIGPGGWLAGCVGCDDAASRNPSRNEARVGSGAGDPATLVIGRATDAIALDPGLPTDTESAEVIAQIFDTLVRYRPETSEILPALATSWRAEAGGQEWIFTLREGVTFHDGAPVDADAVVFSLERQRNPAHPHHRTDFHYWRTAFANVEAIEKHDDMQVRIILERPYAPFLANMALYPVAIVSPRAVAEHGDDFVRQPVGSGPFRFVSWDDGRIVLERYDDHWRSRTPGSWTRGAAGRPRGDERIRRLIFQTIPDHRQRLVALESGAIDLAHSIAPEELPFVELHPRLELHRSAPRSINYLALNTEKAPFDDVAIRRAINHAINKRPIVKVLWQGMAIPAHSPLAPGQWGHYVNDTHDYDPDESRSILAQATEDGRFDPTRTFRLYVSSTARPHLPNPERLGRAIQANLHEVGLDTEMIALPLTGFREAVQNGEHDMAIHGWVSDNGDPDNVLFVLFDRNNAELGRASNIAFYRDPEVHGLLVVAQESDDRSEREALYARVQSLLHEHVPHVPLAHSRVAVASRRDIVGIVTNPTGIVRYDEVFRTRAGRYGRDGRSRRPVRRGPP